MAQKVCFLPEALVAFTAVKGFLSCVRSLVCEEMGTLIEGFATLRAAIGSVSQVDPLVGDEVWLTSPIGSPPSCQNGT